MFFLERSSVNISDPSSDTKTPYKKIIFSLYKTAPKDFFSLSFKYNPVKKSKISKLISKNSLSSSPSSN
jgi:hypothetical protein